MLRVLFVIAATAVGIAPAAAAECKNPKNINSFLPPSHMQHEPYLPFERWGAEVLNVVIGSGLAGGDAHGKQMYGYYFAGQDKIVVCKGLTGKALRVIRMHEEAHKLYGWRH